MLLFGLEVIPVVRVVFDRQRDPSTHRNSTVYQPGDLQGIVGDEIHGSNGQASKHLRGHIIATKIIGVAQVPVGLVGIHPLRLKRVRFDLVAEADSPTFLAQIENNSALVLGDEFQGSIELLAAIALQTPKDFAGEALGVDPDRYSLAPADLSDDQGHVFSAISTIAKYHGVKGSPLGG